MNEKIEKIVVPLNNVPVLPLRNSLLFPGQIIPVVVGRPRSVMAVEKALEKDKIIFVVAQKEDVRESDPSADQLHRVGVLARIENKAGGGGEGQGFQLLLAGIVRFEAHSLSEQDGVLYVSGHPLEDQINFPQETVDHLVDSAKALASELSQYLPQAMAQFMGGLQKIKDPILISHMLSQNFELPLAEKQFLLEMLSLKDRFLKLLDFMAHLRDDLKVQHEVQQKVSSKLGKQQREALLREQIKTLQDELGEGRSALMREYMDKITSSQMPSEVEKVAMEQLARLETMNNASPEVQVIRNYLDLLVAMPWSESADETIDLDKARRILESDHHGLEKIKKRIIEHLAVMKLKPEKRGSILLFVGPPGVGKTSLARSIAESLSRPYVRVSLGGVRDDAEIRGHRRTYVGAMPGRIVDGIKRAGKKNPVFVLDEIDKLSRGFSGDPASALLEVLDPEQNAHFQDHYLDVPFDLSHVFFIGTANSLESIPGPLLDRLEVIQLSGYTHAEKLDIAKRHLVPKQLQEHGISTDQMVMDGDVLRELIAYYTKESGVRELQRVIAAVIRGSAEKVLDEKTPKPIHLAISDVVSALGERKFVFEVAEKAELEGVVTGLAWTPVGGDILFVEAKSMPGTGQLTVTGQLGEVMKESAMIAWTHVRSRIAPLVPKVKVNQIDVHLHVPAGAIPKDGPSAGVTMLVALASMILGRPIRPDLGMTGEVTLRGAVTPVGGIKEKLIAAHRAGLKKILLPRRNERDLKEVPEAVLKDLEIVLLDHIEDVLRESLGLQLPLPSPSQEFDSTSGFA